MTMFAIRRLSNGLNGLGDFDVRRSGILGDPDDDENCQMLASRTRTRIHDPYLATLPLTLALKIVVALISNQDAASEVVQCSILIAFQHRPREPIHIRRDLLPSAWIPNQIPAVLTSFSSSCTSPTNPFSASMMQCWSATKQMRTASSRSLSACTFSVIWSPASSVISTAVNTSMVLYAQLLRL
jgi:hypothetical protein